MAEPIKQIVQKQLNQTPFHEFAQSEPVREHENNEMSSNNQAATKHKKRKRHKKIKHHKDPQQIKEIKLQRINIKRQGLWNNRFINDTIPDLFNKAKKRKSEFHRRNKSPLETVYMDKDVSKQHKFPQVPTKQHPGESIQKQARKSESYIEKSFNIRSITKKEQVRTNKKTLSKSQQQEDKIKPNLTIQKKDNLQNNEKRVKALTHGANVNTSQKSKEKDRLLAKLQQTSKLYSINQEYKALLLDLIDLQATKKSKQLRTMLEHQIKSIGKQQNAYTRIEEMIKERRKLLKEIEETGQATTLRTLMNLQVVSVSLIEEILKFKAKWEEQYYKLQKPKKVSYFYQGKNYLLSMNEEVKGLQQQIDPFLVSKTAKLQNLVGKGLTQPQIHQKKQMILKMRACELLLIEEVLSEEKQ